MFYCFCRLRYVVQITLLRRPAFHTEHYSSTVILCLPSPVSARCAHPQRDLGWGWHPESPGLPTWSGRCWHSLDSVLSHLSVLLFLSGKFPWLKRKQKKISWSLWGSGCYFLQGRVIDVPIPYGVIPRCLLYNLIYKHISQ